MEWFLTSESCTGPWWWRNWSTYGMVLPFCLFFRGCWFTHLSAIFCTLTQVSAIYTVKIVRENQVISGHESSGQGIERISLIVSAKDSYLLENWRSVIFGYIGIIFLCCSFSTYFLQLLGAFLVKNLLIIEGFMQLWL